MTTDNKIEHSENNTITELFGSMVFNDRAMKQYLPRDAYYALKNTISAQEKLDLSLANIIAEAMKNWAIEKGATHFTHWFQPLTGITAEKHDSFIDPDGEDNIILKFSGKQLIVGESDASSFPSGGLRSTFEARGYTAWDPTSFAFIKDATLCIPTAFMSFNGLVLDNKTPLLRSMKFLTTQVKRFLKLFGKSPSSIKINVGAEQEYFLISKDAFLKRKDLVISGRTLFGAKPPKGQELDDHYFGTIKPNVLEFMKELDFELWKLGIYSKTRHNEAAPSQHELAPVFTVMNIAADHNQLTMEMMKKVAKKYNLVCLLHEKPFNGVAGSGKHNNWSISTDSGENLLDPGKNPQENLQFLLMLACIIKAVDVHQDLLRLSIATPSNDLRLGGHEAPPAILSMFLGTELVDILDSISHNHKYTQKCASSVNTGTSALPSFAADSNDRNRTSPFAFTGNKFEFRMPGSSVNISSANVMLNTAIGSIIDEVCSVLENSTNLNEDIKQQITCLYNQHNRILFNGNNYSKEWVAEAKKRGLLNLKNTPSALPYLIAKENIEMFEKYSVYTKKELESRHEIMLNNYVKTINIEVLTMIDMVNREILPAVYNYINNISTTNTVFSATLKNGSENSVAKLNTTLVETANRAYMYNNDLQTANNKAKTIIDTKKCADHYLKNILPLMNNLREECDTLETLCSKYYWPFPVYSDLLFTE